MRNLAMEAGKLRSHKQFPHHLNTILPVLTGVITLTVYILTLAPGLTTGNWGQDGGDWITAAYLGRLAHPPGAPLYWIMTRMISHLPFGSPAWRMNLFSAVCAAATAVIVHSTLIEMKCDMWVSLTSALAAGFTSLFWSQAVITEVYTLAGLCVAAVLRVLASDWRRGSQRSLLIGLLTGLAGSVHLTTLVLVLVCIPERFRKRVVYLLGVMLGLSLYAIYLLIRPCTQVWGDMCTLSGWWQYVTAYMYRGYAFGLRLSDLPARFLSMFSIFSLMFTPLGALVILIGLWKSLSRKGTSMSPSDTLVHGLSLRAVFAVTVVALYAILYDTSDSLVYLVSVMPLLALLFAHGLEHVRQLQIPTWSFLLIPLMLLAINWSDISHASRTSDQAWSDTVLGQLPENALVVTERDVHTFDMWYSVLVEEKRSDLVVVSDGLRRYPWYQDHLQNTYSDILIDNNTIQTERPECVIRTNKVICD